MTVASGSDSRATDVGTTTGPEGGRSWGMRARSLLFGLVGLALLVGLPLLLWTIIGNPIDRFPQSLDEASDLYQRRYVPTDLIVGLLAVVLWLVWLQFVWSLIWEVAVVGPAATRGVLARSAPLAPKLVRSVASSVVSGMLTATVVVGSSSLASVGSHVLTTPAALATDAQIRTVDAAGSAGVGDAAVDQAANRVYTVGASESLWSIAGRNDAMVKRLLELNDDKLRSPIDVRPGMELMVPASLIDEPPAPIPAGSPVDSGPAEFADDVVAHIVVEGDNLWNISKADLSRTGGSEPSNQQVADKVSQLVARNREVVEDPDLIYPGEVIELRDGSAGSPATGRSDDQGDVDPAADEIPAEETAVDGTSVDGISVDDDIEPADVAVAEGSAVAAGQTRPVGSDAPAPVTENPEPTANDSPRSIPTGTPSSPSTLTAGDSSDPDPPPGLGIEAAAVAAAFGSMIAASGLLMRFLMLRRKRSSALGAGSVRREGPGDAGDHRLAELAKASDLEFTRWAAAQLQTLFASLPETMTAAPVSVRLATASWLSSESGVSVLWDTPMPAAIPGWQAVGDRQWFRAYDDTRSMSHDPGPAAIPGLLTLGEIASGAGERELFLLDLEAFGSLAIGGSPDQLEAAAQAMVFEAGSGELLSNIAVTTVDFDIDGAGDLERVSSCSEDLALAHAETIVAQYEAQTASSRFGSSANGQRDVELFVINTVQANTDRWLDLAKPHCGVAVLLLGDMRSSRLGARLTVDPDGVGTLTPVDIRLNVPGLLPEVAQQVGELFDRVLETPAWPEPVPVSTAGEVVAGWSGGGEAGTGTGTRAVFHAAGAVSLARAAIGLDQPLLSGGGSGGGSAASSADTGPVVDGPVRLTVLGRCRCEERPDLVARALSLVAFLAVQPDMAATKASIIEAVWGGRSVSDGQFAKVVAAARAQLGPERLPKQLSSDGPFRLHAVETDLHVLQRLVLQIDGRSPVEAAPLLRQATDLIDGPPFSGVVVDWAAGNGFIDYAAELIESVTIQALEAMVAVGDLEAAGVAATRGLVALPTNEPIHRAYMQIAADLDDVVRVRSTFDQLETSLSLLHPTAEVAPSRETIDLHDELVARLSGSPVEEPADGTARLSAEHAEHAEHAVEPKPPKPPVPPVARQPRTEDQVVDGAAGTPARPATT